jgi:hypothetical protein
MTKPIEPRQVDLLKKEKSLSIRKGFFVVGGPDDPASGGRTRLAFGEMPGKYSNGVSR